MHVRRGWHGKKAGLGGAGWAFYTDIATDPGSVQVLGAYSFVGHWVTNNVTEYAAVLCALIDAKRLGIKSLTIHTDCGIIMNHMPAEYGGYYKTTSSVTAHLAQFRNEVLDKLAEFERGTVTFKKVAGHSNDPGNDEADKLAKFGSGVAFHPSAASANLRYEDCAARIT